MDHDVKATAMAAHKSRRQRQCSLGWAIFCAGFMEQSSASLDCAHGGPPSEGGANDSLNHEENKARPAPLLKCVYGCGWCSRAVNAFPLIMICQVFAAKKFVYSEIRGTNCYLILNHAETICNLFLIPARRFCIHRGLKMDRPVSRQVRERIKDGPGKQSTTGAPQSTTVR